MSSFEESISTFLGDFVGEFDPSLSFFTGATGLAPLGRSGLLKSFKLREIGYFMAIIAGFSIKI